MSEAHDQELVKFGAILDEFAAAQRSLALTQVKRQRITVMRRVGDMTISFETLVDEGADADEIFGLLAPLDVAVDRLQAKANLSDHYGNMLNACGEIDLTVRRMAADRAEYEDRNRRRNVGRRTELVGLSAEQQQKLTQARDTIRQKFERIEELKKAAAECRRVLAGEDPFAVLDDQINTRIDALRGQRPEAA